MSVGKTMGKYGDTVFVHPSSVQLGDVTVGEYSSLWPGSSIRGDYAPIRIGGFTSVQDCAVLHTAPGAPMTVGDLVTVAHGAVLHGCTIEDGCLVGMNAVVQDRCVLGAGSMVAAGAVVREGTRAPAGSLLLGVPAAVKPGRPGQAKMLKTGALSYVALAQNYLRGRETITAEELVEAMVALGKIAGIEEAG